MNRYFQILRTWKNQRKTLKRQVKHALREGDLVVVHSHVRMNPNDELGMALVHIFRFKDNRVAELWDIGEPVPAGLVNENGMF